MNPSLSRTFLNISRLAMVHPHGNGCLRGRGKGDRKEERRGRMGRKSGRGEGRGRGATFQVEYLFWMFLFPCSPFPLAQSAIIRLNPVTLAPAACMASFSFSHTLYVCVCVRVCTCPYIYTMYGKKKLLTARKITHYIPASFS